jgi:imidazole glycerol phosphate synthase subunit HisF
MAERQKGGLVKHNLAQHICSTANVHFGTFSIRQMKEYLAQRQIPVNL